MKTFAVVENGVVVNVVLWDGESEFPSDGTLVPAEEGQGIGWEYKSKKWTPPVEEVVITPDSSVADAARASGIAKLVALGLTEEEALALVGA